MNNEVEMLDEKATVTEEKPVVVEEKPVVVEEKPTQNQNNNKKGKGSTVVIILLILIILGLVAYIAYDKGLILKDKTETTEENKTTTEEIKAVDLTKCLNTTNLIYSNLNENQENVGLEILTNSDTTKLKINWDKFGPISGATAWASTNEELNITNLATKVKSGFVGGEGQDPKGTILFYLMEDGTVEYTKVFNLVENVGYNVNYVYAQDITGKITGQHFESQGKVKNVENVVKIYTAQVSNGQTGYMTTIAAKKDGSFYDLGYAIRN